jgi:diguanylate cyclase (GGDEF)-like protein
LTDPLAGLANRRRYDEPLPDALLEAERNARALWLLIADADHFKTFNYTHRHLLGDQVLRLVASSAKPLPWRESFAMPAASCSFETVHGSREATMR